MFTKEVVEILSAHIQIVHHTKGRVRFKIDTKIQNYSDKIDLNALANLDKKIEGIRSVALNKLARSLTIEYEHTLIAQTLWDELANSDDYADIAYKLNNLLKED